MHWHRMMLFIGLLPILIACGGGQDPLKPPPTATVQPSPSPEAPAKPSPIPAEPVKPSEPAKPSPVVAQPPFDFSSCAAMRNVDVTESIKQGKCVPAASEPAKPAEPSSVPSPIPAPVNCPSIGQFEQQFGIKATQIEGVAWEPCSRIWQSHSKATVRVPLPKDWQATVTRTDGSVAVYYGEDNLQLDIMSGTFRFLPSYPSTHVVHDKCRNWGNEHAYGQRRNPPYDTVAGNFSC